MHHAGTSVPDRLRSTEFHAPLLVLLAFFACLGDSYATSVPEVEEVVTSYAPADNGAGPMWCYGSTCVARQGNDVYASAIETGEDIPPLCNTRWQLWHRTVDGWKLAQHEERYRQREPCPIGVFPGGPVFLSINPSTEPPGVKYGPCHPLVLEFDPQQLNALPKTHEPVWVDGTCFTDHSYRGFGVDGENHELLLLNVNAQTGDYFLSYYDHRGSWQHKNTITFPIRACYPQVALRNRAAHILAIGDIVEPVEEWRKLKFEKLNRKWDYVFRRLFYCFTPDITKIPFTKPIEVATVEKTGGHITNLDLYIDEQGTAHLLYLQRPFLYDFLRDRYFPGEPMTVHLEYATVRDGQVVSRRTLAETSNDTTMPTPSYGRFHIGRGGMLYVIVAGTAADAQGKSTFGNYVACIRPGDDSLEFTRLDLKHPFRSFFTNTPRGGSKPSEFLDLFGTADDSTNLRYARVRVE